MKNRAEVTVAGQTFTMMGEQEEEYMVKIAALVDQKISESRSSGATMIQAGILAACDMADSYVKAVQSGEHLRQQMAGYLDENKRINRDLASANAEIARLQRNADERAEEMEHLDQLKDHLAALEKRVAGEDERRARIDELESQLSQTDQRVRAFQEDADKRNRRIKDLEQSLAEAENKRREDTEEAEEQERVIRGLKDKLSQNEKQRRRVEELEKVLADAERQLGEVRKRLSRAIQ